MIWTPRTLFELARNNPRRLISRYLMAGHTPAAFPTFDAYHGFLEAVAERVGLHPRAMYLRGSCQIGFSIAPRADKVWAANHDRSDLDLVIVDHRYFRRIEADILRWEARNPADSLEYLNERFHAEHHAERRYHRLYNCCWDEVFPPAVGVHHKDTMRAVADLEPTGFWRKLSAYIYPDWLSAKRRYERDIRQLVDRVTRVQLDEPGDAPVPARRKPVPTPAAPAPRPAPSADPADSDFRAGIPE